MFVLGGAFAPSCSWSILCPESLRTETERIFREELELFEGPWWLCLSTPRSALHSH